ncbi:GumC family protein [Paraglaciecola chathamensis]|uniref:non-specific protein-tyrosine kinase n=1 Tax=Paraglaciecola chathamensis TaxID=368405 RepID=A0A8H9LWX9_9ALTE|nr:polysaccharide biosynthesis tyrosine autokinase [Paraglaciecola oceanifecundans]GGZ66467.1 chain-length determining protein [Paraglaciecola oceanifecundans]
MSAKLNGQLEAKLLDSEMIDLGQYWQTVRRYLWRIISLAIFITVLVALIVMSITPQYKATAKLLIESKQAKVLSIEEVYGLDSSRKEYFQTQYEILKSRQVAEKVVEKLKLYENPTFAPGYQATQANFVSKQLSALKSSIIGALPFLPQKEKVEQTEAQQLAARKGYATYRVMQSLQIAPINNTQIVEISFEHEDRQFAAIAANAVGDVYIENYLESKLDMTTKATTWLNESLQGLRTKLTTAEKRLSEFYETEKLVNIDGVVGLAAEELQKLSQQLLEAQVAYNRAETLYNQVNSGATIAELADLPEVLNHPAVQNVKREQIGAQSKVSELSKVYGPKHPKMIAAQAELTSIRESLNDQIRSLISGVNTEFSTAKLNLAALKQEVSDNKENFRKLTNLESRHKALQREVDINQQLYSSFFTRLNETSELGGFESANARMLDLAVPPGSPSKPKKGLIIAAAFIVSLGFGVFLALAMDALNSGIRSVEDVERKLGQRMLGLIPWEAHSKKKNLAIRHFFDGKHHSFSEAVRTLRTSLQLLNIDKPSKTILVTSSVPKEGKSTVSINLAFAMGQLSKVLLIDTDLRRPTLASQFSLPGFQPGIANLISGTHTLEECIVTDEMSGIDLICAGTVPPNPQELLASDSFKALMQDLKGRYEHIIVDSAPTQAVSDAIVVSKVCDSVVYVVKADSTSDKLISNGLSRFLQVGHRVDGVVLNQVDLRKAKKHGEYTGFYDQYGYHSYNYESNTKAESNKQS